MSQLLYSKYRECFVFEPVIEDDFRFTRRDESFSMGVFLGEPDAFGVSHLTPLFWKDLLIEAWKPLTVSQGLYLNSLFIVYYEK